MEETEHRADINNWGDLWPVGETDQDFGSVFFSLSSEQVRKLKGAGLGTEKVNAKMGIRQGFFAELAEMTVWVASASWNFSGGVEGWESSPFLIFSPLCQPYDVFFNLTGHGPFLSKGLDAWDSLMVLRTWLHLCEFQCAFRNKTSFYSSFYEGKNFRF